MSNRSGRSFETLIATMHRLRAPGGCPWDAEQTHASLKPYVVEEAYELCEAIDAGDEAHLLEELGDVLLQVVFHAELATERGAFTIADVADALVAKLERRHPHVFGDTPAETSAEVVANWARIKAQERKERGRSSGALAGVPRSLPALLRAHRLGEKAGAVGFDWPDPAGARAKIDEELRELDEAMAAGDAGATAAELGDVLFAASSHARLLRMNGETALQSALDRFQQRFEAVEAEFAARGRSMSDAPLDELQHAWERAKEADAVSEPALPQGGPQRDS
jgi:MazG family protein